MTTQTISQARENEQTSSTQTKASAKPRLLFIDNLRILLTILVILHHLAIVYGAPGSWDYVEGQPDMVTSVVLTLFVAVNQAFFMGFFFMIAGYFTPGSYDRKGAGLFIKDRLLRLGVPVLFYVVVIDPLLKYVLAVNVRGFQGSLLEFLTGYLTTYDGLEPGPLWFVETLLIFSIVYGLWRLWTKPAPVPRQLDSKPPGNLAIALFALLVGIVTFIVRIWLPFGWNYELLDLQFPYFPQYIALFVVGVIAYRRNWFLGITDAQGKLWLGIAIFTIFVVFPLMLVTGGALEGDIESVRGGLHWQSFVFSIWEQFVCMGMVIGLLVLFRKRFNHQGHLAKTMSASAYTAFIIQAPVGIPVVLVLSGIGLYPLLKFPLVSLIVVSLCFLLGNYIRRLPLARNIL